jgi:Fe2+ or Zn2+ uptake regulation protein
MERSEIVKLLQDHSITPTRQRIEIAAFLFKREQHRYAENILS